ncbi:unnamed protein product [Prorocentrum cordatum]|uniref:Uncharacterized protein n=1 Tax=Prorocentrum cordatum TaxID=2364126 RepID=A0ABN9TUA3_9DINO|nr:unnamed protein product [Polarella glacialis]
MPPKWGAVRWLVGPWCSWPLPLWVHTRRHSRWAPPRGAQLLGSPPAFPVLPPLLPLSSAAAVWVSPLEILAIRSRLLTGQAMAALRSRSPLAALAALALACRLLAPPAFVPAPAARATPQEAAVAVAAAAAAAVPSPVLALASEDDDGFDVRIIAVLALPLLAASWALFNVWRVAFRQGARIGEGVGGGNSKIGLAPEE